MLDWKFVSPYTIKKKLNPYAYKLDLSAKIKIYPTVYLNLLQPSKYESLTREVPPLFLVIINNGDNSYFIDLINDMR